VPAQRNVAARVLDTGIFCGLLVTIVLTAVPYGTVESWSHASFQVVIFSLGLLWVVHGLLAGSWRMANLNLFYPLIALVLFAILQSLSWSQINIAGTKVQNAISADPFESWIFAIRVSALTLAGVSAVGFTNTLFRLSALVHTIILVAVISGIFGIARQTMQHDQGFILPFLKYGGGFAQFINKNHFAFLVEAAMGLLVGIALLRKDRSQWLLVYLSGILLLWVALVMSRSRGGLLAVTVQAVCAVSLFIFSRRQAPKTTDNKSLNWKRTIVASGLTILVVLVLTIAGIVWLGGDQLTTGVETATIELDHTNLEHEGTRRSDIWRATWQMARAHPIAGAGLGGFWAELPKYHDASGVQTPQQAHNDYLELFASGGLIGAAIFVWFVVLLIRKGRAIKDSSGFQRGAALGSILGILGIAVHSLVEFGLHITINALVFMMLLAILSIDKIDQRPNAQAHRNPAFN
jgi:O-antigen ligase